MGANIFCRQNIATCFALCKASFPKGCEWGWRSHSSVCKDEKTGVIHKISASGKGVEFLENKQNCMFCYCIYILWNWCTCRGIRIPSQLIMEKWKEIFVWTPDLRTRLWLGLRSGSMKTTDTLCLWSKNRIFQRIFSMISIALNFVVITCNDFSFLFHCSSLRIGNYWFQSTKSAVHFWLEKLLSLNVGFLNQKDC